MAHQGFETATEALDFMFSGKAVVTLTSISGKHFTFKLSTPKTRQDIFFVNYLYGPDNSWAGDWKYTGFVAPKRGRYHLVSGHKGTSGTPSFTALQWALKHLSAGSIPESLTIQHNDSCGKCGKPLTDPISVARGLGPVCRK